MHTYLLHMYKGYQRVPLYKHVTLYANQIISEASRPTSWGSLGGGGGSPHTEDFIVEANGKRQVASLVASGKELLTATATYSNK